MFDGFFVFGFGDRFSIYFELLLCIIGFVCLMICICFFMMLLLVIFFLERRIVVMIMIT